MIRTREKSSNAVIIVTQDLGPDTVSSTSEEAPLVLDFLL